MPNEEMSLVDAIGSTMQLLADHGMAVMDSQTGLPRLRSATSTAVLTRLADAQTLAGLQASMANPMSEIVTMTFELFGWSPLKDRPATKAVAKAVGAALTAKDANGKSLYAKAVEVISFSAALTGLLEPDQIALVIKRAMESDTATVYAPIRSLATLTADLDDLLSGYPPKRRVALLVSLWEAAHDTAWWDLMAGATPKLRRRRRKRIPRQTLQAEMAEVIDTISDDELLELAAAEKVVPDPNVIERLAKVVMTEHLRGKVARILTDESKIDPHAKVVIALLPDLPPALRPVSPIGMMAMGLVSALLDEDGNIRSDLLPNKPKTWAELYPEASVTPFPTPEEFLAVHGKPVPGLAGSLFEVLRSANELKKNADFMGNCTYSYKSRAEAGSLVMAAVLYNKEWYNLEINRSGQGWRLGQVNTRFNRGRGAPEVANAVTAWLSTL